MSDQEPILNDRQALFVKYYLISLNATQAAIQAGYSPDTARQMGAENLTKPSIVAAIAKEQKKVIDKLDVDAEKALRLLVGQAVADPRELSEHVIDACRFCWGEGNMYQRTANEMAADRERFEEKLNKLLDGDEKDRERAMQMGTFDEKGGIGFDPRKGPNPDCMECFGRGIGKTIFKDTRFLSESGVILYAGTKTTKDGTQILTNSQDAARANVAKHFGLLIDNVNISGKIELTEDERIAKAEAILERIAEDKRKAQNA